MANYRQIHTRIWKDDWFNELSPEAKVLFIYLFSNEGSSFTGLYPLSLRVMSFESGLDYGTITEVLNKFEQDHKVFYRDSIVWVVKMWQYHKTTSDTVIKRFNKDLDVIPDSPIKRAYQHYIDTLEIDTDTLSIPYVYGGLKKERKNKKEEEGNQPASTSVPYQTGTEAQAERVYQETTGAFTIPSSDRNNVIIVISRYIEKYGTEAAAVEHLKPYYEEWVKRDYSRTNLAWITGWAAQGSIPKQKATVKEPETVDPRNQPTEEYF